ncbi:MAG TPA: plastocyanin/azurin family copper-binding protein [Polyangiaceae bacterium]
MESNRRHLACAAVLVLVACGKAKPEETATVAEPVSAAPAVPSAVAPAVSVAPPEPVAPKPAPKVELELKAIGTTMTFDKTALTVPAGSEVHLVIKNAKPGTLAHNWVLVKPGMEAAVAAAGLAKGAAENYIAPGPDVIAYTPLTAPGKTSDVTFLAPPAGAYPYICSFPGHYMMMKGVLTVTP